MASFIYKLHQYIKLLAKLTDIEEKLAAGAQCTAIDASGATITAPCPSAAVCVMPSFHTGVDSHYAIRSLNQMIKLLGKKGKTQAIMAALETAGVDITLAREQHAAAAAAKQRKLEDDRLDAYYTTLISAKQAPVSAAPSDTPPSLPPLFPPTLIERTQVWRFCVASTLTVIHATLRFFFAKFLRNQEKIAKVKTKIAALEEKLRWLQSNPTIPGPPMTAPDSQTPQEV